MTVGDNDCACLSEAPIRVLLPSLTRNFVEIIGPNLDVIGAAFTIPANARIIAAAKNGRTNKMLPRRARKSSRVNYSKPFTTAGRYSIISSQASKECAKS